MKNFVHPPIDDVTLPGILYALGDDTRLQIVKNLAGAKAPLTCSQAVENIDELPVSTQSHHFRVLRESGVIRTEKQGRECHSRLRKDELETKFPGLMKTVLKCS